jgi:hypothetical protein
MIRRKTFLLFSIFTLVLLTQVIVLHWGLETIFFVTWLFLALVIQHDSRLSIIMGLACLATCPFLLILNNDLVAEQAANYAYFFLAIGVIVQLEEFLLERYHWLPRKVDLSYLWHPMIQGFSRQGKVALAAFGQGLTSADRTKLIRLIQVLGITGLVVVLILAAFSGAQLLVVLPFLVGALLFPFIIWGLQYAMRTLEPTWLLRVVLALFILPLLAMELVWLYNLISADQPARMTIAYDFIGHLSAGRRTSPVPQGEDIEMRAWTIGDNIKQVLYQHPAYSGASRVVFTVPVVPGEHLAFDISTAPESWHLPGDGVTFAIYAESEGVAQQLFSAYIDPKKNAVDRRWYPVNIDLSSYAGKTIRLIFETGTGPAGDYRYDWAGWGEPRLLKP